MIRLASSSTILSLGANSADPSDPQPERIFRWKKIRRKMGDEWWVMEYVQGCTGRYMCQRTREKQATLLNKDSNLEHVVLQTSLGRDSVYYLRLSSCLYIWVQHHIVQTEHHGPFCRRTDSEYTFPEACGTACPCAAYTDYDRPNNSKLLVGITGTILWLTWNYKFQVKNSSQL